MYSIGENVKYKPKWKFSKEWEERIREIVRDEFQKIEAARGTRWER